MSYRQFAYYYDRLMREMPYAKWLQFAQNCWARYGKPSTVADLGCGTGNISIPIAQQGVRVYGLDLSEDMLAVAQSKSDIVTWLQQDMREWQLTEPVDAAISFCDCLNYLLEEEDVVSAFRQTFAGLRPGGMFVFDVHTPYQLNSYAEHEPYFLDEEDAAYIWNCSFEEEICEIEHDLTIFVQEGDSFRRFRESHVQRAFPLKWLERQLYEVGFTEVNCYADFEWRPVDEETERAFFVCRKAIA